MQKRQDSSEFISKFIIQLEKDITSGRDYVTLPPAIYACKNLNTLFVTHIILNIIYYYSFRIFPRFWLVKTTRITNHNQHLERIFAILNQWRQKCSQPKIIEPMTSKWRQKRSPLQIIESITEKTWGQGWCYIWWAEKTKSEMVKLLQERGKYFEWITKQLLNLAFVGYEEFCRSRRVLSTLAFGLCG